MVGFRADAYFLSHLALALVINNASSAFGLAVGERGGERREREEREKRERREREEREERDRETERETERDETERGERGSRESEWISFSLLDFCYLGEYEGGDHCRYCGDAHAVRGETT